MNKILPVALTALFAVSSYAETSTVVYTFANDEIAYWGKGKKETIDVAMALSDPALKGKKIVSISALLNTDKGSDVSMWLTKELKLEK